MSNPFIVNKHKIINLLGWGIPPSDEELQLAWEMLVEYLGYDPILAERHERDREVGDSNRLYTKAIPITEVEYIKVNSVNAEIEYIEKNYIKFIYIRNTAYKEFPYPPYELNKVECKYSAGYPIDELPMVFYMFAALYLSFITDASGLASYSIDTISESYRSQSEIVNNFIMLLNPFITRW